MTVLRPDTAQTACLTPCAGPVGATVCEACGNGPRSTAADAPPAVYVNSLGVIITQLQQDIRELLLRELMTSDDDATPPEYRELVDRYFEVLSRDIGR